MAESFNTPLLSVVSSDSAGLGVAKNSSKIGASSANDGQRDDFSRVLDGQKNREPDTQTRADAASGNNDAAGKALPSEGNTPADTASNDGSASAEPGGDTPAGGSATESAQSEGTPADSADTLVSEGAQEPSLDESDESVRALELNAQNAVTLNAVAIDAAAGGSAAVESDSAKAASYAAATAAQNDLSLPKDGPLKSGAAAPTAVVATNVTLAAAKDGLSEGVQGADMTLAAKSAVSTESTRRQGLGASSNRSESALQIDATALKQTTADWLRASMGAESSAQRGADFQLDGASDLLRGATAMPRGDGAVTLPSGSAPVAGLAPTAPPSSVAAPPSSTALPEYSLARAPDDADFPGELTARMKTLVRDGVREARLQLHPAELGRLQVTVITEGDQTKVAFTAETAAARDAIEQSLPRLREMLEQSGLQLAQSDVGEQGLNGGAQHDEQGQQSLAETEPSEADTGVLVASGQASSRIDTYI